MISSVVGGDLLKGVPRESVAAMVIDRLDRGHGEKPHALTVAHASCEVRDARASSIEQESFDGMVIQSTKSIRDIEAMVSGVEFHLGKLLESSITAKEKRFHCLPYNQRFKCIARCQKYCQVSTTQTPQTNCRDGTKYQ